MSLLNNQFSRLVRSIFIATTFLLSACGGGNNSTGSTTTAGITCSATTIPSTPSIAGVSPGNASANIYFSAPIPSGGTAIPISSYIATSNPGNITAVGTNMYSPIKVIGLANGTSYTFTIQAVNCLGTGRASTMSAPVTPSTVPSAPTNVKATRGNAQASVSFSPPLDNGGAAIINYAVSVNPGGQIVTGTASPIVVSGLLNGTSYTFTVSAQNISGIGPTSTPSVAIVPSGAPTNVLVTANNAGALVKFTPPMDTGATGYTVTSSPGGITAIGTSSPISITGLTNNTAYTFTVTATYLDGLSTVSSPSNLVIPISNIGPYFINSVSGSNTNSGTYAFPFKTITYALAVAAGIGTANTINVAAGTYNSASGEVFPLQMLNNVNLVGSGSANTMIDGAGFYSDSSLSFRLITTLAIPAKVTSTVSGFSFAGTDAWQQIGYLNVMAVIDDASATFNNNIFVPLPAMAVDGVWILHGSNAILTGNTITGTGWNRGLGALLVASTGYGNPHITARSNTILGMNDTAISVLGNGASNSPTVDLGTLATPGNNIINGPTTKGVGLSILGVSNWVSASGNIWNLNTQGSSATGTYGFGTTGVNPTPIAAGNNYAIDIDMIGTPSVGLQF